MSKKGIAKVVATGLFLGGITIAGVNYTGSDSMDTIKQASDNLQERVEQASADVNYLQGEFDALNGLYLDDMVEANEQITKLIDTAIGFREQIRTLQDEIEAGNTDNSTAQEDIQTEITRLENELTQANNDIADLEAYVTQLEAETQYDPINKEAYVAEDLGMPYTADFISLDAYELNYDLATQYAENAIAVMNEFSKWRKALEIVGVSTFNADGTEVISYVISEGSYSKFKEISDGTNLDAMRLNKIIGDLFGEELKVYFELEGGEVNPFFISKELKKTIE